MWNYPFKARVLKFSIIKYHNVLRRKTLNVSSWNWCCHINWFLPQIQDESFKIQYNAILYCDVSTAMWDGWCHVTQLLSLDRKYADHHHLRQYARIGLTFIGCSSYYFFLHFNLGELTFYFNRSGFYSGVYGFCLTEFILIWEN